MSDVLVMKSDLPKAQPTKNRGGRWVVIGGEQYLVPPLSFRSVIDLQEDVGRLQGMNALKPTADQRQIVESIVLAALKRNYPEMKADDVADMLDLSNFSTVLNAVLSIGGFERRPTGDASGEAPASIGTPSTAA